MQFGSGQTKKYEKKLPRKKELDFFFILLCPIATVYHRKKRKENKIPRSWPFKKDLKKIEEQVFRAAGGKNIT